MKGGRIWNSGFTLLELAVAGALGALLLSAVVVMSARGMAVWRRTDSRLQALSHLERGLSRMGEDLRNGTVPADAPFRGAKEEMGFTVAEDSTHLAEVRYRLVRDPAGRSSWVRERRPFPGGEPGEEPQVTGLADGVTRISLEYGAVGEADGEKVVQWVDSWDDPEGKLRTIPKVVRVHLEGTDGQGRAFSVTRDLWVPQGQWKALASE